MKLYATIDAPGKTRTAKMASEDCLDIQIYYGNRKVAGVRVLEDAIWLSEPKSGNIKGYMVIGK